MNLGPAAVGTGGAGPSEAGGGAGRIRLAAVGLVLVALALVLHAGHRTNLPDGFDSVDFALALDDFDVPRLQPHFPGYPLYVALGRLVRAGTGGSPIRSLSTLSLLAGALAVLPLLAIARRLLGGGGAAFVAMLWIVAPLPWIQSVRPASDMTGLFLVLVASSFLVPVDARTPTSLTRLLVGSTLLAFSLGARPSSFPFLAMLPFAALLGTGRGDRRGRIVLAGGAALVGLALWVVPLAMVVEPLPLVEEGIRFTRGHLLDWGGTVAGGPGPFDRAVSTLRNLVSGGFGGAWPTGAGSPEFPPATAIGFTRDLLVLGATILGSAAALRGIRAVLRNRKALPSSCLAAFGVPYALWVLLFQNPGEPRHVLPLVPVVSALAWLGLPARGRPLLAGVLIAASLAAALPRLDEYGRRAPAVRLAREVASRREWAAARLYGGSAARVLRFFDPARDARVARDLQWARRDAKGSVVVPGVVLFAGPPSSAQEEAPGADATLLARYDGDPMVFGKESRLDLWRLEVVRDR